MLGLYDLLDAGVAEPDLTAWLGGRAVSGLPPLSPKERRAIGEAWWFWARPGQFWTPGPERITVHEGGRGAGKSWAGSSAIFSAANDPERWGGYAVIAGRDPTHIESDMIYGLSGIVSRGRQMADVGVVPDFVYNPSKMRVTFRAPRGGGTGLTVMIRQSSKPEGGHGPNAGLLWADEFSLWRHRQVDEQGRNLWRSIRPAIRAGRPDSKIIITMTPSRVPEVRVLQADAERPECPACKSAYLAEHGGRYSGDPLQEPWRLPRSPQRTLHPLLNSRTTEVLRECPACGGEVVAKVRTVFFDTRDNPHTDAGHRQAATDALATGAVWARQEYAPIGEADSSVVGSLVDEAHIQRVELEAPASRAGGPVPDLHMRALDELGADEVVVFVDPAVTATDSSDETGVVPACVRRATHAGREVRQVVGLTDDSVRPDEVVGGAPSAVWAPRAYWQAVLWGARRIIVENNQGGEEVLSAVRDECARPPTEAECLARLRGEHPAASDAQLSALARRLAASARGIVVEHVRRRADKRTRVEWYGRTASLGQQAVLCVEWQGGARHWQTVVAQATGYEPPRADAPPSARRDRKDRWDALCAAGQVLLGVRETARGEVEDAPGQGWMGQVSAAALR